MHGCKSGKWNVGGDGCLIENRITKHGRTKLFTDPDNYVRNPENLANLAYAHKGGNGSEESGDGYKYRGRGLIQLTLKDNYKAYTDLHNQHNPEDIQDFVENPDLNIVD